MDNIAKRLKAYMDKHPILKLFGRNNMDSLSRYFYCLFLLAIHVPYNISNKLFCWIGTPYD